MSPNQITKILDQIFNALNYLHTNQIVHQDFNTKNILIDPKTLQIKIVDFGLAKYERFENQVFSPQGDLKYRPPIFYEGFQNRFFIDVWGFSLVVLSLMLQKKITTKKALRLLEKEKHKYSDSKISVQKDDINLICAYLETEILGEGKKVNRKNDESPLKCFPCKWS